MFILSQIGYELLYLVTPQWFFKRHVPHHTRQMSNDLQGTFREHMKKPWPFRTRGYQSAAMRAKLHAEFSKQNDGMVAYDTMGVIQAGSSHLAITPLDCYQFGLLSSSPPFLVSSLTSYSVGEE